MTTIRESVDDELRKTGLRATPSRVAVLDLLYASKKPLDVQTILDSLHVSQTPDQATVYRIVRSLVRVGLAREVYLTKGVASYEVADQPHHHHLTCEKCGLVEDVSACCEEPQPVAASFDRVTSHTLEFSGICNACAR